MLYIYYLMNQMHIWLILLYIYFLLRKYINLIKITDKIYLGRKEGIYESDYLEKEKINAVLSVTDEAPIIKNITRVILITNFIYIF